LSQCHNIARLIPRDTDKQTCTHHQIDIDPMPDAFDAYDDFFGNKTFYFSVEHSHKKLEVTVTTEIEKEPAPALEQDFVSTQSWESIKQQLQASKQEFIDVCQYIPETIMTASNAAIKQYALISFTPNRSFYDAALDLMKRIFQDFEFVSGFTTISTPLAEVMEQRKGVCQDFAHLAIACIRSMGLPARYVSGYIETLAVPGKEKLVGVDASHAWFAMYVPGNGWLDFDPTNNQVPDMQHITTGWGRDYTDIAPLKGVIIGSGPHQLTVSVDVRRV